MEVFENRSGKSRFPAEPSDEDHSDAVQERLGLRQRDSINLIWPLGLHRMSIVMIVAVVGLSCA